MDTTREFIKPYKEQPYGKRNPFAVKPTLHGALVTLRPYIEADLPHLAKAVADREVQRLTGSTHTSDQTDGDLAASNDRLREWYTTRNQQTDRLDLMIVDRVSNQCVGEVVLNEWDGANESCNFRILIGPDGRDRGLGSEATRLMVAYAFTHLPLHRIELEVYAFNPRAQRIYEKAGFIVEGKRRDAFLFDGERIDAIMMSILKPDLPQLRSLYQCHVDT
jgi:RimJ/RimL family protein N-acetyltransferase